jgi:D-arabinose 1-dehydrogenase-like Zn-dependent alcohol dehydrogenase
VQVLANDDQAPLTIQKVCHQYLVKPHFQGFFLSLKICKNNNNNVKSHSLSGSVIGGIAETQEMLDFCGRPNITADVEIIPVQKVNEAYKRLLKSDVKYRFSIDMASLKSI